MFDRLEEVRSVARARAQEDFGFFCSRVLGLHLEDSVALAVQEHVERGGPLTLNLQGAYKTRLLHALEAWLVVLRGETVDNAPSDTFEWLFPESLRQNVAA